jgi:hypothetical protein
MVKSLLLVLITLFFSQASGARTEYRGSFIDKAMTQIREPALHFASVSQSLIQLQKPADGIIDPRHHRRHYTGMEYVPHSPQEAYRRLFVSGTVITAIGTSGTILGAATLQNDSRDNPVSLGLMIVSIAIALIGVGLLIAGFYIRANTKSIGTHTIDL